MMKYLVLLGFLAVMVHSCTMGLADYGQSREQTQQTRIEQEQETERTRIEWSARIQIARINLQATWPYFVLWLARVAVAGAVVVWALVGWRWWVHTRRAP